ncbi:copper amine oxidase N-terminal domain-containing protein [Ureibacillus sinduriensis]|uniref:Copper amine oxidase-like N-terminal domain-containing protein n=1 Tax=Ureibacillus sinduriensis BLB-1 = JCM 15800 TaxID=1384057 RepID=A0A0A3HQE8_9BACL|nr:copper amine oxidase N-terminal domain-containing protein [Ureibacillus sinduriensis]KGR74634.1 hypothetical protein CD33_16225 [Ureibacillus sinduriensis BLB-1 = JCM 15800]
MKKLLLGLLATFILVISSGAIAEAHPGRTDSNGGHTCKTNCAKWGYETGEYHYHNGGSSKPSSTSSSSSKPKYVSTPAPVLSTVDVYIDDILQNYNPSAYVKKGVTLVPMRAIFEELGATLDYNNTTKMVTAYKDQTKIVLTVGNNTAYVHNKGATINLKLTNSAEIYKGTTMVPLRFISESLGATTEWKNSSQSVYITNKN